MGYFFIVTNFGSCANNAWKSASLQNKHNSSLFSCNANAVRTIATISCTNLDIGSPPLRDNLSLSQFHLLLVSLCASEVHLLNHPLLLSNFHYCSKELSFCYPTFPSLRLYYFCALYLKLSE